MESKFKSLLAKEPKLKGASNAEKEYRMALFFESVAHVEESNSKNDGRAKLEVNAFSLLNNQEKKNYLGFKVEKNKLRDGHPRLKQKRLKKPKRKSRMKRLNKRKRFPKTKTLNRTGLL